jgi:hypothetical protein
LNAAPSTAIFAPNSEPAPHVDVVDFAQEGQRLVGAQLTGAGHECADVLRQAAAAETQAGVEESASDPGVVPERIGEQRHVGSGSFAHLGDRVDERDLGRQKGVRRDLDQLCRLQIGHQERNPGIEHRRIQFANRGFGTRRIILHAQHYAVGVQGVLYGKPFPQKLGVPSDFDVHAGPCGRASPLDKLSGSPDRNCRLADDHRRSSQSRNQRVDYGVDMAQVGAVFAPLLRGADAEEMHFGEFSGQVVVRGEPQAPGSDVVLQHLSQPRLVEGNVAGSQLGNLTGIDVDADNFVPQFGHPRGVGSTQITRSKNGAPHTPVCKPLQ